MSTDIFTHERLMAENELDKLRSKGGNALRIQALEKFLQALAATHDQFEDQRRAISGLPDSPAKENLLAGTNNQEAIAIGMLKARLRCTNNQITRAPWKHVLKLATDEQKQRLEEICEEIKRLNENMNGELNTAKEILSQMRGRAREMEEEGKQSEQDYKSLVREEIPNTIMGMDQISNRFQEERQPLIDKLYSYSLTIVPNFDDVQKGRLRDFLGNLYHAVTKDTTDMYGTPLFYTYDENPFDFDDEFHTEDMLQFMNDQFKDVEIIGEPKKATDVWHPLFRIPPHIPIETEMRMRGKEADDSQQDREEFESIDGHVTINGKLFFLVLWKITAKNTKKYYQWLPQDSFPHDEQDTTGDWVERSVREPLYVYGYGHPEQEDFVFSVSYKALQSSIAIPDVIGPDVNGFKSIYAHFDKIEATVMATNERFGEDIENFFPKDHSPLWALLDTIRTKNADGVPSKPIPQNPTPVNTRHRNPRKRTQARLVILDEGGDEDEVIEIPAGTAARPSPTGRKGPRTGGKHPGKSIQIH